MRSHYLQLSSIISDFECLTGTTNASEAISDAGSSITSSERSSAAFVGTAGIIGPCILGCGSSGTTKSENVRKGTHDGRTGHKHRLNIVNFLI